VLDQVSSIIVKDQFSGTFSKLQGQQAQAGRGFDDMGASATKSSSALSGLGRTAGLLGISLGVGTVLAAGKAALSLGNLGIQSLTVKRTFDNMLASVGLGPEYMDKLRVAAGGTVTDLEIMTRTSFALADAQGQLGKELADALPKLLAGAETLSQINPRLGNSAQIFDNLVSGIKRGRTMQIEQTGIVIDQARANQEYAESIGKTVKELTEQEKITALLKATMAGMDRVVTQAGGALDGMATSADQLKVAWIELRTTIGEGLAPEVGYLQGQLARELSMIDALLSNDKLRLARLEMQDVQAAIARLQATDAPQWWKDWYGGVLQRQLDEATRKFNEQKTAVDALVNARTNEINASEGARFAHGQYAAMLERTVYTTVGAIDGANRLGAALGTLRGNIENVTAVARIMNAELNSRAFIGGVDVLSEKQYITLTKQRIALEKQLNVLVLREIITTEQRDYRLAQFDKTMNDNIATLRSATKATADYGGAVSDLADDLSGLISAQLQPTFSRLTSRATRPALTNTTAGLPPLPCAAARKSPSIRRIGPTRWQ
jgi:hypothetical protein